MEDCNGAYSRSTVKIVRRLARIEHYFGDFWSQLSFQRITLCLKTKLLTKIWQNGEIRAIFYMNHLEVSNPWLQRVKHSAASSFLSFPLLLSLFLFSDLILQWCFFYPPLVRCYRLIREKNSGSLRLCSSWITISFVGTINSLEKISRALWHGYKLANKVNEAVFEWHLVFFIDPGNDRSNSPHNR